MGKGKTKRGKPTVIGEEFPQISNDPPCTCSHDPPRATDGHNVEGWADEDIRVYNELLTERAKLEKEKNDLEQKSARHHAERALLNEDAAALDNLFKPQLGGEYKFIGTSSCCLDLGHSSNTAGQLTVSSIICKHELCGRAKNKGVSWMEMDTIKYYQARIMSEKSQRMQNALRKQRDVELARVKKEDDEDNASRARKSALLDKALSSGTEDKFSLATGQSSNDLAPALLEAFTAKGSLFDSKNTAILDAAKENEAVVRRIRTRLDKIRHDVNAGRVTPFDARVKLEQANTEMAEAERKNNAFREMIWTAESGRDSTQHPHSTNLSHALLSKTLASSGGDAFSQALSVMKGFFSASDPRDVQAAITDLRSVLEINGPMSPVLQKSFQALEDMLAKPNAKGFSVDMMNSDGTKRTCTNVVDVLLSLRQSGRDLANLGASAEDLKLDKATIKSNDECAKIEASAQQEMERELERIGNRDGKTLYEALKKIKDKAVMKSPIPPLSDIVLDEAMSNLIYCAAGRALVQQTCAGATERDLAGKITSTVISNSGKKTEKYMQVLAKLSAAIEKIPCDGNLQPLRKAIINVQESMEKFVAKHTKKGNMDVNLQEGVPKPAAQIEADKVLIDNFKSTIAKANPDQAYADVPWQAVTEGLPMPPLTSKYVTQKLAGALQEQTQVERASARLQAGDMTLDELANMLRGMDSDELVNMLCGLDPHVKSQTQDTAKAQLKHDLHQFLALPTGHENPILANKVRSQIENIAAMADEGFHKHLTMSKNQSTSRFREDLSDDSPPPPYMANQERSRQIKVKHVAVNTPQIQDGMAQDTTVTSAELGKAMRKMGKYEENAILMTKELDKIQADLENLAKAPGLEGLRARKTRRELGLLRKDMKHMAIEGYRDAGLADKDQDGNKDQMISKATSAAEKGKGKSRAVEEPKAPPTAPAMQGNPSTSTAATTENDGEPAASKKSKKKKKRGKKATNNDTATTNTNPTTNTNNPLPTSTGNTSSQPLLTLSERELVIKRQLSTFATYLDTLSVNKARYEPEGFGFRDAFDGIFAQLEEQMLGHIEMAWHLSTAHGWVGLKQWLREEFASAQT